MMTPLTSSEAIRANNARAKRQFMSDHKKRQKRARAEARRVAALRGAFAPRVEAQARAEVAVACAATKAARAAVEAGRALQALDAELREATHMEVGDDYIDWHPDGLSGCRPRCAHRDGSRGRRGRRQRVADDATRIAVGAEAFALAFALTENE
jgi:hypothetical protein